MADPALAEVHLLEDFLLIGGLLFATPTTLLVVPYLFAMLRRRNDGQKAHGVFAEAI